MTAFDIVHLQPRWLDQAKQRRTNYVSAYHKCLDNPAFKEEVVLDRDPLDRKEDPKQRAMRQARRRKEAAVDGALESAAYKQFWARMQAVETAAEAQKLINKYFHWYDKNTADPGQRRCMGQALKRLGELKRKEGANAAAAWQEKRRKELEDKVREDIKREYGLA